MRRLAIATFMTAALALSPARGSAQEPGDEVLAAFEPIAASVIRIRTIADLESERIDGRTGERRMAIRPYSVDGTGVVVGEVKVGGRSEYLVLTNHHVADASNYVLDEGGYLRVNPANTMAVPSLNEESYLMREAAGVISGDDIRLIELVRRVRGDMTLMRTEGANRRLAIFPGKIGYLDGEILEGAPVLTSGFPWGTDKIVAIGTILDHDFPHSLGLPHRDFVVDLPVEPGQSGGPIFLIEGDPSSRESIEFRLIGLVHAKDHTRNYGVPYLAWENAIDEFPAELEGRLVRQGLTSPSTEKSDVVR